MMQNARKRASVLGRFTKWMRGTQQRFSEIIGRTAWYVRYEPPANISYDYTTPDYEFWDRLSKGYEAGYEIGGLFVKPTSEIISGWTLGDGIQYVSENEAAQTALDKMAADCINTILNAYTESMQLGNVWLFVNPDATISIVPAVMVTFETEAGKPREFTKVCVRSLDQQNGVMIEDTYTATERVIITRNHKINYGLYGQSRDTQVLTEKRYPNPLGRIPCVLIPNNRSSNEIVGRPLFEPALPLIAEYEDVIRKALSGVKLLANPIPVINGINDANSALNDFADDEQDYYDYGGNRQTKDVSYLSRTEMFATTGNFQFASPSHFTPNTMDMLRELFQMILRHTQIPEWVWGGAISSSMASVDAQFPAFEKFIMSRRRQLQGCLIDLAEIYLGTVSQFSPVPSNADIRIKWSDLSPESSETTLKWAQFMRADNTITRETSARISGLVENPAEQVEAAQGESVEGVQALRNQALADAAARIRNGGNTEPPESEATEQ